MGQRLKQRSGPAVHHGCLRDAARPKGKVDVVAAGQSGTSVKFAAHHADYNVNLDTGVSTPIACAASFAILVEAVACSGIDFGGTGPFHVIVRETDVTVEAKWQLNKDGTVT